MPAAVIDTNIVLATRSENAPRHGTAMDISRGIDRGHLPQARALNCVLPEILHPLQNRFERGAAFDTLDWLQRRRGCGFVHVPTRVRPRAEELSRRHESDTGPGWTDSVIAAYMPEGGSEYIYSFDDGFDSVSGITRLDAATDPFAP